MRTTFGEMVLEVANDRRNVNDINTVVNTAPRKAGSHVSVTSPQAEPPPQALRFRMAEASAKRVTAPYCLLPAFLCANIFIKRETSGTPEHPRRACSQERSQATGLLQYGFFRCHATLLSTPPLWGGALRDDTKEGCVADYGFSRPDVASGWGSLFQAARYSSGELRTRK
ncbi:unnamed protein product [Porites evermanni]|uniref:Uncharacterized protein n=1 Tax=Porites evermanni TaxID=104178 RepID=A0ABN8MJT4_9CNID|nr:unnamed protein product [Porites evermanni]